MKNQKGVSLITLIITIIVVIILAIIILRSGVSNTPDQASFSGFTKDMGELQDNVKLAMLSLKGDEAIRGNNRSEAQLYNAVARGGYEVLTADASGDKLWLIQADAKAIPCTLIRKDFAKKSLGMELPVITVETAKGTNQEVSFFVTPKGTVFCWPPYLYDGKSYVTADYALNMDKVDATDVEKNATVTLEFGDETVIVSNDFTKIDDGLNSQFMRGNGESSKGIAAVWYGGDDRTAADTANVDSQEKEADYRGVAASYLFDNYNNSEENKTQPTASVPTK